MREPQQRHRLLCLVSYVLPFVVVHRQPACEKRRLWMRGDLTFSCLLLMCLLLAAGCCCQHCFAAVTLLYAILFYLLCVHRQPRLRSGGAWKRSDWRFQCLLLAAGCCFNTAVLLLRCCILSCVHRQPTLEERGVWRSRRLSFSCLLAICLQTAAGCCIQHCLSS